MSYLSLTLGDMTTNTETLTCEACDEEVAEDQVRYGQDGTVYHDECWFQEFDYASTVWIIDGSEPFKVLVCAHGVYDGEYLEDYSGSYKIGRGYHKTDGWRGYYETRIEGLEEVEAGWTTGNWGDAISDSKQAFNNWVASLIEGEIALPENLVVVVAFDPTSNVFSTGCSVFTNDPDLFAEALTVPEGL